MTEWLLSKGAKPNARYMYDITLLSIAVQKRSLEIIELLFRYGGSVNFGQLLHKAALGSKGRLEALKLVLSKYSQPPINQIMYQDHPASYNWYCLLASGPISITLLRTATWPPLGFWLKMELILKRKTCEG
jgi:hypothetical protein